MPAEQPSDTWRPPTDASPPVRTSAPSGFAPMALALFAEIHVRDFQAAKPWYVQFLGEPAFAAGAEPGSSY